jgi:hypothetical protein
MVVIVPHHHAPTAKARALGDALAATIQKFERENGAISPGEIHQAVRVALARALEGRRSNLAGVVAVLVAVALAAGVFAFLTPQQRGSGSEALLVLPVVAVIIAALFVARLRRG